MQLWCFAPSAAAAAVLLTLGKPLLMLFGPEFAESLSLDVRAGAGFLLRALAGPAQNCLS